MSSRDQENIRRAEYEIRNASGNDTDGSSATWFLAIVVVLAIIGSVYVFGTDPSVTPAGTPAPPPAVTGETPIAPATPVE